MTERGGRSIRPAATGALALVLAVAAFASAQTPDEHERAYEDELQRVEDEYAAYAGSDSVAAVAGSDATDAPAPPTSTAAPPSDATLTYHLVQNVLHGGGAYEGWSDMLVSVGDYRVQGGAVHAHYVWRYAASDRADHGETTRDVTFDVPTRNYRGQTDLDEYDHTTTPLATWLWIPPDSAEGTSLQILEQTFAVVGHETVGVAGGERPAIHLSGFYDGHRNDEYGTFTTSSTDEYWFDAATGMFLRETRSEHDSGQYRGDEASFDMNLTVEVVDASYAPHVGAIPAPPAAYAAPLPFITDAEIGEMMPWILVGSVPALFMILVVYSAASRGRARQNAIRVRFTARALGPGEPIPSGIERLSPKLGTFLPHFVEVARASQQRVFVAYDDAGALAGLGIDDSDSMTLAVYATSGDCAETLRTASGRMEIVSETRFAALESVSRALEGTGGVVPGNTAYNLFDRYDILGRTGPIEPLDYDARIVVRMTDADVAKITPLTTRVYGASCEAFLRASLAAGDVAFVAREGEHYYGLALATVVGTSARLHMLTVDPDLRSRGIAKELYRARLRALSDLGVDSIVTEVAQSNPAAVEVARQFGMTPIGLMYVQSARAVAGEVPHKVHRT